MAAIRDAMKENTKAIKSEIKEKTDAINAKVDAIK